MYANPSLETIRDMRIVLLLIALFVFPSFVLAERWTHDSISVEATTTTLRLSLKEKVTHSHFLLKAPPRFVIDLKGLTVSKNGAFTPANKMDGIRAIRIGRHGKETRIVVDCESETVCAALALSVESNALLIGLDSHAAPGKNPASFQSDTKKREANRELESPATPSLIVVRPLGSHSSTKTPLPASTALPSPTPTSESRISAPSLTSARHIPAPSPKRGGESPPLVEVSSSSTPPPSTLIATPAPTRDAPLPSQTPEPTVTPVPTPTGPPKVNRIAVVPPAPTGPALKDIAFDYLMPDRTPVIRFAFTTRREYRLTKIDATTYELTVIGTKLGGEHLALHFFPPNDFLGFTFVKPRRDGNNIVIAVGVDYGMRIASVPKDEEIWVKAISR